MAVELLEGVLEMRVDFGCDGIAGERRWIERKEDEQVEDRISSRLQRNKDDSEIDRCRRAETGSFPVWKVGQGCRWYQRGSRQAQNSCSWKTRCLDQGNLLSN